MFFIEIYKSSYTGNTLYGPPTAIEKMEKTLSQTAACKFLRTVKVIKFDWCKEKNGFYWWPGYDQLMPRAPFAHSVPPLQSLTGKRPEVVSKGRHLKKVKLEQPFTLGELFCN